MNPSLSDHYRSAAAQNLVQLGDFDTQASLSAAVARLEDDDLPILEDELEFFGRTGFVGILMSEMLSALRHRETSRIAA